MSKLNLLIHINGYEDENATNNPSRNNFKWQREVQGIDISEPTSKSISLPPGQSLSLFSGTVSTSADATTTWDLELKTGTSNTYKLSHAGGTAPLFRTPRIEGHDATTEVTITKNAKILTFTATGGTIWDLSAAGVSIGDEVKIGDSFNQANRGTFKILSLTSTSFTVENSIGVAEGPITLGADFADEVNIYSADGVQVGDKIDILDGFSSVSFGTYEITDVSHDYIEFYSNSSLPEESGVSNSPDAFLIYRDAKSFLYIESDKKLDIKLDGASSANASIEPFYVGTKRISGVFMSSASIKSAEIENKSQETATIFCVTAE